MENEFNTLRDEIKNLIEDYKTKFDNIQTYSKDVGYEDVMEGIIKNLENLLKII